jgi:hypothetical protein
VTWHWDIVDGDLVVWDDTLDPATDTPLRTLTSEDGWTWTDYPDAVLDVMHDEAQTAIQTADLQRAIAVTLDMAGEQIERAEQ